MRSAPLSQGVGLLRLIFDLNHIAPCRDPSALPEDRSEGRGKQQIKFRQVARPPDSKLRPRIPHAQNQTVGRPNPVDRHTLGIKRCGECYPFCLRLMKRGKSDGTQLVILMENHGPNKRHFLAFRRRCFLSRLVMMHGQVLASNGRIRIRAIST
jgi:hypothetical protein